MKNKQESEQDRQIRLSVINEKLADPNITPQERQSLQQMKQEFIPGQYSLRESPKSKPHFGWSKKKLFSAITILLLISVAVSFIAGTNMAYPVGYNEGANRI